MRRCRSSRAGAEGLSSELVLGEAPVVREGPLLTAPCCCLNIIPQPLDRASVAFPTSQPVLYAVAKPLNPFSCAVTRVQHQPAHHPAAHARLHARLKRDEKDRIRGDALGLGLLLGGAVFAHARACGCTKAEILAIDDDSA